MTQKKTIYMCSIAVLLTACSTQDMAPPRVSIASPAEGSRVTGTQPVQVVASDDTSVLKVTLYARTPCKVEPCPQPVRVGSSTAGSNTEPFLVNWYTLNTPNNLDVEILAEAEDEVRNTSMSDPVRVTVQNNNAPNLLYVAGFTVWPDDSGSVERQSQSTHQHVDLAQVKTPKGWQARPAFQPQSGTFQKLAGPANRYAIEWAWASVAGATAYRPMWSQNQVAEHERVREQDQAPSTGDKQYFYKEVTEPKNQWGTVRALLGNTDSALSNTKKAEFLPLAETEQPTFDQTLSDGRPTLKWKSTAGAEGYTYRVLDRHPDVSGAQVVWSNGGKTISGTSVVYPAASPALPTGSYYYQVIAYKFRDDASVSAVSFSTPIRFMVP